MLKELVYVAIFLIVVKLIEVAAGPRWQTSIRGLLATTALIAMVLWFILYSGKLGPFRRTVSNLPPPALAAHKAAAVVRW